MQLNNFMYRNGFFLTIALSVVVVWGFWPSFYSHPLSLKTNLHYVHGVALSAWFFLLILQPLLIRIRYLKLHSVIGRLSFVIAPIMVISVLLLIHYGQHLQPPANDFDYAFLFLLIMNPCIFTLLYGLAIYYRSDAATHARFMISTAFILAPAGLDRLMVRSFPDDGTTPVYMGWFGVDLIILGLAIWDWRSHKRLHVFPLVLVVMLFDEFSWQFVGKISVWRYFADWFAAL
ncbi:MAG TPA: hypothetical protein VHL14_09570 [Steroidobacteraceae bacterium]|jgi:hypothetical protein|nr:hypothetical protein [Steroidobacteraceae bacterium]